MDNETRLKIAMKNAGWTYAGGLLIQEALGRFFPQRIHGKFRDIWQAANHMHSITKDDAVRKLIIGL